MKLKQCVVDYVLSYVDEVVNDEVDLLSKNYVVIDGYGLFECDEVNNAIKCYNAEMHDPEEVVAVEPWTWINAVPE